MLNLKEGGDNPAWLSSIIIQVQIGYKNHNHIYLVFQKKGSGMLDFSHTLLFNFINTVTGTKKTSMDIVNKYYYYEGYEVP